MLPVVSWQLKLSIHMCFQMNAGWVHLLLCQEFIKMLQHMLCKCEAIFISANNYDPTTTAATNYMVLVLQQNAIHEKILLIFILHKPQCLSLRDHLHNWKVFMHLAVRLHDKCIVGDGNINFWKQFSKFKSPKTLLSCSPQKKHFSRWVNYTLCLAYERSTDA